MGCIWLQKDGCKGFGSQAVGYWGRDIYKTILSAQVNGKELANLKDELEAGGVRAYVWKGITEGTKCSCYKYSYKASDRKCRSCHGVSLIPGYLKFGYNTIWASPLEDDSELHDVEITNDFRSANIRLIDGKTTGYFVSADKEFSRTVFGSVWEYNVASFVRIAEYSSIVVQYSLDSGLSWTDISQLPLVNPSTGKIRFKVTLNRDDDAVLSPLFEIVRARYSEIALNRQRADGDYFDGPWIKIMKSVQKVTNTKGDWGDSVGAVGMNFWTVGMSAFDSRIEMGSDGEKLEGPNIVIEFMDGVMAGKKGVITDWALSDPRGYTVMSQSFSVRLTDGGMHQDLIW
jgi:hypothetical protein